MVFFNIVHFPKKMSLFIPFSWSINFTESPQPRRMHQLATNCFSTITAGAQRLLGNIILCHIFSMTFWTWLGLVLSLRRIATRARGGKSIGQYLWMHRNAKPTPVQTQMPVTSQTPTSGAVAYLARTCHGPESSWNVTGQPTVFTWLMGNTVKRRRSPWLWSSVLRNLDNDETRYNFYQLSCFLLTPWISHFSHIYFMFKSVNPPGIFQYICCLRSWMSRWLRRRTLPTISTKRSSALQILVMEGLQGREHTWSDPIVNAPHAKLIQRRSRTLSLRECRGKSEQCPLTTSWLS